MWFPPYFSVSESECVRRGSRGGNYTKLEARVQIWCRSTSGATRSTFSMSSTKNERERWKRNFLPRSKTMGHWRCCPEAAGSRDEPVPSAWHQRHSGYWQSAQQRHPKITAPPRLPASHRTKRLQHVESMCALWAKISDRVAEVQQAINGPHCAACEWKFLRIQRVYSAYI